MTLGSLLFYNLLRFFRQFPYKSKPLFVDHYNKVTVISVPVESYKVLQHHHHNHQQHHEAFDVKDNRTLSGEYWNTRFPFYNKPRLYTPHEVIGDKEDLMVSSTIPTTTSETPLRSPQHQSRQQEQQQTTYIKLEDQKISNTHSEIIIVQPSDYTQQLDAPPPPMETKKQTKSVEKSTNKSSRRFSCKYCDKDYMSLGALKMHIRTHTLPCKCNICGKAFSRPWLLQGHIRTHTGERPFGCSYCGRAFADRSNLRAHIQTHTQARKFECGSCSKTFTRASLLKKHESHDCPITVDRCDT